MKVNVGSIDRIIRFILAALIAYLLITSTILITSTLGMILSLVAIILTATALVSSCPIYSIIGLSSKGVKA